MKRTDITSLFPEATDDQINALMNINGNDINNARRGMEELQASLTEAQARLTAQTTAEADLAAAREQISALQADIEQRDLAEAIRTMRDKVAGDAGIPASLLTGTTEDECKAQAQGILDFVKPRQYPNVRDAGETHVDMQQTTRQQFADWFNSQ